MDKNKVNKKSKKDGDYMGKVIHLDSIKNKKMLEEKLTKEQLQNARKRLNYDDEDDFTKYVDNYEEFKEM